jgi:ABC-2 type transport system ATP-binding protein/lipopolysaccharide transport system ATP-binding protein
VTTADEALLQVAELGRTSETRRLDESDIAINVSAVSKRFRLYTNKPTSLKQRITRLQGAVYDEFWALKDVSLAVPRGCTYGLIGHNGSGKSTMLRMMAGIHRPTSGQVTTKGRISALLELGAGFHPELSGRENIYLNGSILGLTRRELRTKIDDIIDFAGLGQFIDSPVKVYSSGMYVRLGFAVAVHVNPEILIIDEVIAVGDEEFQRRCFDHLYKLRREGLTIVLVSHSLGLMESMCDRVAWFDHGVLQEEGDASHVVRSYVGKVNDDENERLSHDQPVAGEVAPRHGTEIEIVGVEYLDERDEILQSVRSGDPATIRLRYRSAKAITNPVVGLAVHHESGAHIAGPNTRFGGLELGVVNGEGFVDYRFEQFPLLPGGYRVSAAITDWNMLHVYDYADQTYPLHVQPGSNPERFGYVSLGGQWAHSGTRSR